MFLLIPLIIVIGLYFGITTLQEHIHEREAKEHNHTEQQVPPDKYHSHDDSRS